MTNSDVFVCVCVRMRFLFCLFYKHFACILRVYFTLRFVGLRKLCSKKHHFQQCLAKRHPHRLRVINRSTAVITVNVAPTITKAHPNRKRSTKSLNQAHQPHCQPTKHQPNHTMDHPNVSSYQRGFLARHGRKSPPKAPECLYHCQTINVSCPSIRWH